uniref:Uncharacterized protein n=1 Tax=Amphimedon queenslandica TaxID=400682 RepID=A0A1X7U3R2_AMPQE
MEQTLSLLRLVVSTSKWQCGRHFVDYLESSGWTTALTEAKIGTSGVTDSLLKATHLMLTRHAHIISAPALSKLQHDALLLSGEDSQESWRKKCYR